MSKIRVKVTHPLSRVDYTHVRHFNEALLRSSRAEVTRDLTEQVDFTVGGHADPINGKRISFVTFDPHALPLDYDPRPLYNRKHLSILAENEQRDVLINLEQVWAEIVSTGYSIVRVMDGQKIELVALPARWPFREHLAPLFQFTQLMRCSLSVPGEIFHCTGSETRDVDCFFMGALSHAHAVRITMIETLRKAHDINYVEKPVHGMYAKNTWPSVAAFDEHQVWYADWLRRAKIAPLDGSIWDWPTSRYFEAMACGALVVAPMPHDGDILGFRDGVNMVVTDGRDFMDKIRYYLGHEEERARIAAAAAELVRQQHTCAARADQMIERLEMFHGGMSAADIEEVFDSRLL